MLAVITFAFNIFSFVVVTTDFTYVSIGFYRNIGNEHFVLHLNGTQYLKTVRSIILGDVII